MAGVIIGANIRGLREADNALQSLAREYGPRNARNAFRVPTRRALLATRDNIAATTPVDTGRLVETVGVRVGVPNRFDKRRNPGAVYAGRVGWFWPSSDTRWFQALAVEFGTRYQPPQSILRDALQRNSQNIIDTFSTELRRNITRTANRLERRARAGRLRRR